VVKILTDQDCLYGYGCGTFTQRAELVNLAVEKYLKPLLIGKPVDRIEDTLEDIEHNSTRTTANTSLQQLETRLEHVESKLEKMLTILEKMEASEEGKKCYG